MNIVPKRLQEYPHAQKIWGIEPSFSKGLLRSFITIILNNL